MFIFPFIIPIRDNDKPPEPGELVAYTLALVTLLGLIYWVIQS